MLAFIRRFSEEDSYVTGRKQLSMCRITLFKDTIKFSYQKQAHVGMEPNQTGTPPRQAHTGSSIEQVFTYRGRRRRRQHNRDRGCAFFYEKYYLGYVLLEIELSIATVPSQHTME